MKKKNRQNLSTISISSDVSSGKRERVKARKLERAFRFGAGRIKVLLFLLARHPPPATLRTSFSLPSLATLSPLSLLHPLSLSRWKAKIEAYASRRRLSVCSHIPLLLFPPLRASIRRVCVHPRHTHVCVCVTRLAESGLRLCTRVAVSSSLRCHPEPPSLILFGYNVCASRIYAIDRGWMRERGRKYERPVPASANSFPRRVLHVRRRECDVISAGVTVRYYPVYLARTVRIAKRKYTVRISVPKTMIN